MRRFGVRGGGSVEMKNQGGPFCLLVDDVLILSNRGQH